MHGVHARPWREPAHPDAPAHRTPAHQFIASQLQAAYSTPAPTKRIVVFSHSLRPDGAPTWLLQVSRVLKSAEGGGFSITCLSVENGPMRTKSKPRASPCDSCASTGSPTFRNRPRREKVSSLRSIGFRAFGRRETRNRA